jgi:hypothetical protein
MNDKAFYEGVLHELDKIAQSTQVAAAGPAKPQPQAQTNQTSSVQASAPTSSLPKPVTAPASSATPSPAMPGGFNFSANADTEAQNTAATNPGTGFHPLWAAQRMLTPDSWKQKEIDKRMNNARWSDANKGFSERDAYFYNNDDYTRSAVDKAVSDKTYGVGQLNGEGKLQMGDLGKFQAGNFMQDHWGKILLALLGVGALGWMGNNGGGNQQPINIYNNAGGASQAPTSIPRYA